MDRITVAEKARIGELVKFYVDNLMIFETLGDALFKTITSASSLRPYIHSVKYRVKEPVHLEDKLLRKLMDAKSEKRKFNITTRNLFQKINDLTGIRILHLHTSQITDIDRELQKCLTQEKYTLRHGPIAKTWDDESRKFFDAQGIDTEESKTQYTSVHYEFDVENVTKATFEVQVRTLAEELWGEVDHKINYPHPSNLLACTEQIAVLARVTSSCSRLVDSIFRSHTHLSTSYLSKSGRRKAR
jgi:GTP pyrophosphokinase